MGERHLGEHSLELVVGERALLARIGHHRTQVAERNVGHLREEHRLVGSARPGQRARRERPEFGEAAQQSGLARVVEAEQNDIARLAFEADLLKKNSQP